MELAEKIKFIYPDIDLFTSVRLADLGNGGVIEYWGDLRPQPTSEQLLAVENLISVKNIKDKLSDLAAEKIALIFGKPTKSMELLIKELNLSNRCNELINISVARTLSGIEQSELDLYNSYWARVKAIRAYEKQRSIEIETADINTFDINFGWPE